MKLDGFGDTILDTGELMRRGGNAILNNMGKVIAAVVAIITVAATFTDISFGGIFTKDFTSSVLLILTSGYIIYFSLEDAGERSGEGTAEYIAARERYNAARNAISGRDVEVLRSFLREYSERELESRRRAALLQAGLGDEMLKRYRNGERLPISTALVLRRIERMRPHKLTPRMLLERQRPSGTSELEAPGIRKTVTLILKLIPSTVCTFITLSVVLSAREGLGAADVLSSLLRLSALPMLAFKGYSEGYCYTKHSASMWLETKAGILESFCESRKDTGEAESADAAL